MATLIVWNNKYYSGPGGSSYPGHAALNINDDWHAQSQSMYYVSWWPDNDDGAKKKQRHRNDLNISTDLQDEGYAPDHIVHIPLLNVGKMLGKWNSIASDPSKKYKFLRSNCSTIVSQVLKEGSTLGSFGERNNLVWTPLKCLRLALAMGGTEVRWSTFLGNLNKANFLTRSDVAVLSHLFKRDERHGKNATGNNFHYSGGRQVNPKQVLIWHGGFAGKAKTGMTFFESSEGSMLASGTLNVIGEGGDNPIVNRLYNGNNQV